MINIELDTRVEGRGISIKSFLELIERGTRAVHCDVQTFDNVHPPKLLVEAKNDGYMLLEWLRHVSEPEDPEESPSYERPPWHGKTCDTCRHAPSLPMYTPPPLSTRNPPIGITRPIICIEPQSDHYGHLLMPFHEACLSYEERAECDG